MEVGKEGIKLEGLEFKEIAERMIEATQLKEKAENMITSEDYMGARDTLLQAQKLLPSFDNIDSMLSVCDILCAANFTGPSQVDYYWLLQTLPSVNDSDLKSQYDKLVSLVNPVKNNFPGTDMALELLHHSFSVLSDTYKRSVFDLKRTESWDGSNNKERVATLESACLAKRELYTGEISEENGGNDMPVKRARCSKDTTLVEVQVEFGIDKPLCNYNMDTDQIDLREASSVFPEEKREVGKVANGTSPPIEKHPSLEPEAHKTPVEMARGSKHTTLIANPNSDTEKRNPQEASSLASKGEVELNVDASVRSPFIETRPSSSNLEVETHKIRKSKSASHGRRRCRSEDEQSTIKVGSSSLSEPLVITPLAELSDDKDYTDINSYACVYDNEPHMCRQIATSLQDENTLKFRGTWKSVFDWYRKLSKYPLVKTLVDSIGFGRFFTIDVGNSDQRLVAALIERWWDTTHTFHLPCGELGFTPLDFTMLTGIPIGYGEPLPFCTEFESFESALEYFPLLKAEDIRSYAIRLPHFEIYLGMLEVEGEEEIVARAFLMYALGHCFFPNGNNSIRLGWLAALHDMEQIGCYDWGTPILARLYKALDTCSRLHCKSVSALWQPLEFWFYEYLGVCHPTLSRDIGQCRPRILRWNDEYRARSRKSNLHGVREQIEMASSDSIQWQPWAHYTNLHDADIVPALDLSRKRVLLYDPVIKGTWYLGDRCWRQVTGIIAIPRDPPLTMRCSEGIPERELKALKHQGWIDGEHYVTPGTNYRRYWEKVSIGPLLHVVFQNVNREVAVAAGRDQVSSIPQLSQQLYEPQAHATQRPTHDTVNAGWFVDVAGSGEQTHTIAVPLVEDTPLIPAPATHSRDQWAFMYIESLRLNTGLRRVIMQETRKREEEIRRAHEQIALLKAQLVSVNSYCSAPSQSRDSDNENKMRNEETI